MVNAVQPPLGLPLPVEVHAIAGLPLKHVTALPNHSTRSAMIASQACRAQPSVIDKL